MQQFLKERKASDSDANPRPRKALKSKSKIADQVPVGNETNQIAHPNENDLMTIWEWHYALEGPDAQDGNEWLALPVSIEQKVLPRLMNPPASKRLTLGAFSDAMAQACTFSAKGRKMEGTSVNWTLHDRKFGRNDEVVEFVLYNRIRSLFLFIRRKAVQVPRPMSGLQLEERSANESSGSQGHGLKKKSANESSGCQGHGVQEVCGID